MGSTGARTPRIEYAKHVRIEALARMNCPTDVDVSQSGEERWRAVKSGEERGFDVSQFLIILTSQKN